MIIGITGTLGAGKGTVVEYLKSKGFHHFSAREFISREIIRRGLAVNRDTLVQVANELRAKNSPSYIIEQLFAEAERTGGNAVIESIRTPGEVAALRRKPDFVLLAIDADQEIRYQRVAQRGSETDAITLETFIANEQREMQNPDPNKQNLGACIALADARIMNDGTFEELHVKIEEVLNSHL